MYMYRTLSSVVGLKNGLFFFGSTHLLLSLTLTPFDLVIFHPAICLCLCFIIVMSSPFTGAAYKLTGSMQQLSENPPTIMTDDPARNTIWEGTYCDGCGEYYDPRHPHHLGTRYHCIDCEHDLCGGCFTDDRIAAVHDPTHSMIAIRNVQQLRRLKARWLQRLHEINIPHTPFLDADMLAARLASTIHLGGAEYPIPIIHPDVVGSITSFRSIQPSATTVIPTDSSRPITRRSVSMISSRVTPYPPRSRVYTCTYPLYAGPGPYICNNPDHNHAMYHD